jgi:hypothetical protein
MLRTRQEAVKYCGNIKRWNQKNINDFARWLGLEPFNASGEIVLRPPKRNGDTSSVDWMIIYKEIVNGHVNMVSINKIFKNLVEVMEYLIVNFTK